MQLGKFFEKYGDVKSVKIIDKIETDTNLVGFVNFNDINSVEDSL